MMLFSQRIPVQVNDNKLDPWYLKYYANSSYNSKSEI